MELHPTSYRWTRSGKGPIPPSQVTTKEKEIATELEARYLQETGSYPFGFYLRGGEVITIPPPPKLGDNYAY